MRRVPGGESADVAHERDFMRRLFRARQTPAETNY
jgi:hypothetical protein